MSTPSKPTGRPLAVTVGCTALAFFAAGQTLLAGTGYLVGDFVNADHHATTSTACLALALAAAARWPKSKEGTK